MIVNNNTPVQFVPPSTSGKTARTPRHHGQDQVQLSLPSSAYSDPQKIAKIAAAVQAGTYYVPPMQIAGSIIREMIASL